MSFERFSSSDVYIFEHVGGFIQCCGCCLNNESLGLSVEEDGFLSVELKTPREALAHLDLHEAAGDDIGGARKRIEKEYEDIDAPIEPYSEDVEVAARRRSRIREIFKDAGNNE